MISDFLEKGKWKCIKCGDCCRMVTGFLPAYDRGDGACIYLKDDGKCAIYENRPSVCRSKPGFNDLEQAKACDIIRKEYSIQK